MSAMSATKGRAEIIVLQGGRCPICNVVVHRGVVDHDHDRTVGNNIRGVICGRCNSAIGFFESIARRREGLRGEHGYARTAEIMRNAIAYLECPDRHGRYAVLKRRERLIAARRVRSSRTKQLPV